MNVEAGASALTPANGAGKRLIVEGWRFLPHSYAIVNQWQLLALLRRNIVLKVVDVPFYRRSWQAQTGLFEPTAEQALRSIEVAQPAESADVTLRVFYPFTFSPSRSRLTAVFATLEQQLIRKDQVSDSREYEQLQRCPPPANVSRHAFTVVDEDFTGLVLIGTRFSLFRRWIRDVSPDAGCPQPHPTSSIPILDGSSYYLPASARCPVTRIDLLLRSFAEVCRKFPDARLVLKGMDHLYDPRSLLLKFIRTLSAGDQQLVLKRMTYLGNSLSHQAMATLYQVADAYVSPYRAEGFNLPVLEAAACGIPIICTLGGPTDDFVTDEFARRIESGTSVIAIDGRPASQLNPNLEHLIVLMTSVIEDSLWRKHATEAGPRHVRARYTWNSAVDILIRKLLN